MKIIFDTKRYSSCFWPSGLNRNGEELIVFIPDTQEDGSKISCEKSVQVCIGSDWRGID